ncbi:MAG TPA: Hsp70 family protein, partial [Actinomycetota bacterium]|nr:Hsp70 family protein [Actinomycetota bacterium]
EDAKIELSTRTATSIEFHRPRLDISIPVARREFEELIADSMVAVRGEIMRALELAKVVPGDASLVLRTGGSSSIPAFVGILEEIFDPSIVQERPVYTTVVHGLASHAQELWA